jgi:hypothetical protein
MIDFKARLKRKDVQSMADQVERQKNKKSYDDDRKWKYQLDKAGNAFAIIRFLPASKADEEIFFKANQTLVAEKGEENISVPMFKHRFDHSFKQTNKWFIGVCPTTYGEECPVCNYNGEQLKKTGMDFQQLPKNDPVRLAVSNRKRKEKFYANILVIKDIANPENDGKIFIFEYGVTVQRYIESQLMPDPIDTTAIPCDVSDWMTGRNFKLKIYKQDKQVKYDRSEWEAPGPISQDVAYLEAVWNKCYTLDDLVNETVKEGYDDLEKRLARVVGPTGVAKQGEVAQPEKTFDKQEPDVQQKDMENPNTAAQVQDNSDNNTTYRVPENETDEEAMLRKLLDDDDIPF